MTFICRPLVLDSMDFNNSLKGKYHRPVHQRDDIRHFVWDSLQNCILIHVGKRSGGSFRVVSLGLAPTSPTLLNAWPCACTCSYIFPLILFFHVTRCPGCGAQWERTEDTPDARASNLERSSLATDLQCALRPTQYLGTLKERERLQHEALVRLFTNTFDFLLPNSTTASAILPAISLMGLVTGMEFVARTSEDFVRFNQVKG